MSHIIEVEGLTKSFKGLCAVNHVSLFAEEGKITGMIGPNGAGKSTTFNMICGCYPPTAGHIMFRGKDITGNRAYEFADMDITSSPKHFTPSSCSIEGSVNY